MRDAARSALLEAQRSRATLCVSAATVWELCLLERGGPTGEQLGWDGELWFNRAFKMLDLTVLPIDRLVATMSRRLPDPFQKDPADRFVVATARVYDIPVVTSDRHILTYATLGHVRAIAC